MNKAMMGKMPKTAANAKKSEKLCKNCGHKKSQCSCK